MATIATVGTNASKGAGTGIGVDTDAVTWAVGDSIVVVVSSDSTTASVFVDQPSGTPRFNLVKDTQAANTGNVIASIWSYHNITATEAGYLNAGNGFANASKLTNEACAMTVIKISGLTSTPFDKS